MPRNCGRLGGHGSLLFRQAESPRFTSSPDKPVTAVDHNSVGVSPAVDVHLRP